VGMGIKVMGKMRMGMQYWTGNGWNGNGNDLTGVGRYTSRSKLLPFCDAVGRRTEIHQVL